MLTGFVNGESSRLGEGDRTNDLSLSYVQSQLVFSFLGQLAQLDTTDLGANGRCDVVDFGFVLRKEVGEGRIGILSVVVVLKGLEGRVSMVVSAM